MKNHLPILTRCPLFEGLKEIDLSAMLGCLGATVIFKDKNEPVFQEGDPARQVGIVLSGSVQIVKNDFYGNRSIVTGIHPSQLFGETFACADVEFLPVSIIAAEKSEIMLIDCRSIIHTCSNVCEFHNRMILNLLKVVAAKNLVFNQKLEILSQKTTREKLMTYLLSEAKRHASADFAIPFDRQGLADFLGVERTALSAEISKLRSEGVLDSTRSHFILFGHSPK